MEFLVTQSSLWLVGRGLVGKLGCRGKEGKMFFQNFPILLL